MGVGEERENMAYITTSKHQDFMNAQARTDEFGKAGVWVRFEDGSFWFGLDESEIILAAIARATADAQLLDGQKDETGERHA